MDTLFADISEWQPPLDDSYPYEVLSIRSNDGTYRDKHFTANFAVAQRWLDSGRLRILIVYFVVRPNWQDSLSIHVELQGSDRPDIVSMVDAESWAGQIIGDHSHAFNSAVWGASDWHGSHINGCPRRVIGYLNPNDLSIWPTRPPIGWIVPSYGRLPRFSRDSLDLSANMLAHQYTNGAGFGGGLPEGYAAVRCDMNAANGYSPESLSHAMGIE
jgi:hypothetical protein